MPRFELDAIRDQPWGPAFIREFELVIAANVFQSIQGNETLYDTVLHTRTGHFCRDLDGALEERFLGIIPVPTVDGEPFYATHKKMLAELAKHPRGHWAVYEHEGKFDAYISNGLGGTDTESGHKFQHHSPNFCSFEEVYGTVLSMAVYRLRGQIADQIVAHSASVANIAPGTNFKDVRWGGKVWSNFKLIQVVPGYFSGGTDGYLVRRSRRGEKTREDTQPAANFVHTLKLPIVMPDRYIDSRNDERLISLCERRDIAAQAAWDPLMKPHMSVVDRMKVIAGFDEADECEFDTYASRAQFRRTGDVYSRTAYTKSREEGGGNTYRYEVTFAPGSDAIVRKTITATSSSHARAA